MASSQFQASPGGHENLRPKQTKEQRDARTKATAQKGQAVLDAAKQMNKSSSVQWQKTWEAEFDACPACQALNGTSLDVRDKFTSDTPSQYDHVLSPPLHMNCRCDITLISRNMSPPGNQS